jgi:hypothetical protein
MKFNNLLGRDYNVRIELRLQTNTADMRLRRCMHAAKSGL